MSSTKNGTKISNKGKLDYQALLFEAYGNIVADRQKLNDVLADLKKKSEADEAGELAVEILEATVSVTEGLTRSNAQLVELVKTESKRRDPDGPEERPLSNEEAESVYESLSNEDGNQN